MDTLEQQKISEKTLNHTLSNQHTNLPMKETFAKQSNKNLDTLGVLLHYGKKGHDMKWDNDKDSKKDYKYQPVQDLIKLGLVKVKPSHDNFSFHISLTDLGATLAKEIRKGTSKEKHKLKILNIIFNISLFLMVCSFATAIISFIYDCFPIACISSIFLMISMSISIVTQNPTFDTISEIISKNNYLSEGMYLREISKIMPQHEQEIYKQEVAKINSRKDEY